MQNLIPEIVIGKKYHFESMLIECLCPHCGHNLGGGSGVGHKFDVVVLGTEKDYRKETGEKHRCFSCRRDMPDKDGWYAVKRLDFPYDRGVVPYTQLEGIKES